MEYVMPDGPAPGSWPGLTEIAHATHDVLSAWDDFRFVADAYRGLDSERVLVRDHNSGRGKASGVEIDHIRAEGAQLFRLDQGKAVRLVAYWWDLEADLGLKE